MKKLLFAFATIVAFASCGGTATEVAEDSVDVDTVVVDTLVSDSVE